MRSRGRGRLLPISLLLLALLQLHAVTAAAHRQQQADTGATVEAAPEAFTPEQVSALGTSFASQLAEALADSSSEDGSVTTAASIAAAAGTAGWFSELKKELDQQQKAVDFNTEQEKKMNEYYRSQDKYYSQHSEQHADAYDGDHHSDHADEGHKDDASYYKPEHHTGYSGGHESDGEHAYKHPEEEHHAYGGEESDHEHPSSSYPARGYDSDEDAEGYGPHHAEEEEACMAETARTNCVAGESTDAGIPAPITYKSTVGCCTEPYGQSYYSEREGRDWYGDGEYKHESEEEYKPYHEHSDDEEHYHRHHYDERDTYPYADRRNATAELAYFGGDSLFDFAEAKPECVWSLAYHAPVLIKKNMEQIGLASAVCHFPKGPNSLEHKCGEELLCEGLSFKIQADIYSTYAISKHLPSSNLDASCQALVPNDGARRKQQQQRQQPLQQPAPGSKGASGGGLLTPPTQKANNNKPTASQGPNGIWVPGSGAGAGVGRQQPWLRGEKDQIWNKWSNSGNQQQQKQQAPQQQAPQQPAAQPAKPTPAPQQQPAPQVAAPKPAPVAAAPTPAAAALPKPIPAAQGAPAKPVTAPVAAQPKPATSVPVAAPQPTKSVPVAAPQPATSAPAKGATAPQVPAAAAPQKPATPAPETPKATPQQPKATPAPEQPKATPQQPKATPAPEQPKAAAPQVPAAAAPQKPAAQQAAAKPAWYTKVAEPVVHPPAWISKVPEPSVRPVAAPKKALAAETPAVAAVPAKPAQPEQKPAAATTPAAAATPAAPAAKQPEPTKPAAIAGRRLIERLVDADDEASVGTAQLFIDTPGSLHAKKPAGPQARPNQQQRPAFAHPSRSDDRERHYEERRDYYEAEEQREEEDYAAATPHPLFSGLEDLSNDLLAGPTGLYYGKTTIIAGRIKAISGAHKDYSHGVVEHILSFNGEPVTESALRELHDAPHVKPGAYKLVFFKDSEEHYY